MLEYGKWLEPSLDREDERKLIASLDTSSLVGLRDRVVVGVMIYTFARVALVIDETKAFREAQRGNVPVVRTLAVLDKAAERGIINLAESIARLRHTNFRVRPKILDQLLDQHPAPKSQSGPA